MPVRRLARHRSLERSPSFFKKPGVVLSIILLAQLMVVLDATIVNVALPHIKASLGFSATSLSWVIDAYVLTFGGLLVLGARAGDLWGQRRVFLLGIALFSLSSLAGGLARDPSMLIAFRAAQGLGAALAAPTALSLLTTRFAEGPARLRAIALYATMSAMGGAVGLVAGGLLTQYASWRWVMFVNVPIGAGVLAVGRQALSETPTRHGRLDLWGALTATVGVGAVVFGLIEAGSVGWGDPLSFASLGLGAITLAVFALIETRAEEPVLPLHLFKNATRSAANVARGLVYAGFYGSFFFLSQYLQDLRGLSPVVAGIAFLPIPLAMFTSSQLTTRLLVKVAPEKVLMLTGTAVAVVAMALTATIEAHTPLAEILLYLVLLGAGGGMAMVSLTSASLVGVSPSEAGAASGLVNVFQQLGAALGLAALVTLFGALDGDGHAGPHDVAPYVHGLRGVFGLAAGFAVVALVLIAAFVRRAPRGPVSDTEPLAPAAEGAEEVVGEAATLARSA